MHFQKTFISENKVHCVLNRARTLTNGPASDAELTPSQKFRVTSYIPVIDQFVMSLAHRLSAYENYAPDSVSLVNLRVLVQWRSKVQQIISSLSTKPT